MKTGFVAALIGLLGAVGFSPVMAADNASTDKGFYGGVGFGYSHIKIEDSVLPPVGATASSLSKDESDTGFKIFGGYQLNRNFGVEVGFVNLGRFNATQTFTGFPAGKVGANIKASGVFVDAVGTMPLQNNFSVIGRVGAIRSETRTALEVSGALAFAAGTDLNPKESEINFKAGLGAQYDVSRTLALRGEWERYFKLGKTNTTGEGDVDLFSLSLIVKF